MRGDHREFLTVVCYLSLSHPPLTPTIFVELFLFVFWMHSNEKFLLLIREISSNRLALEDCMFGMFFPFLPGVGVC